MPANPDTPVEVAGARRGAALERWVPGVRVVRTYERSWLRAGPRRRASCSPRSSSRRAWRTPSSPGCRRSPASTRRSPACVGYALFGPSRVLVLGPDSSISPLILAAITPLLAGGDAGTAIALAGMLAILVGLVEIGLGLGKLGFVADLLSKEVQVGYMNGLGITIIVEPAAEAVRVLDRRRRLRRRGAGVLLAGLDQTDATTLARRARGARRAARPPADHPPGAGDPRRRRRRHGRLARRSASPDEGVATVGALPQGVPTPTHPVDRRERRRPAAARRGRHHARLADRHDRDRDELRRPARRRGRARPGDDRHRRGERRRRALPGVRGLHERLAHRGRRAVRGQEPGRRASSAPGSSRCCCCSCTSLLADLPQTALAAVVIVAAFSLMDLSVLRRYLAGAPQRARDLARRHRPA